MQFYKANGKKINYRLRCKEEDATFSARDLMLPNCLYGHRQNQRIRIDHHV